MVTKVIWPALAVTALFLVGCSTLQNGQSEAEKQLARNQPELLDLDQQIAASKAQDQTNTMEQEVKRAITSKPIEDPSIEIAKSVPEVEPDPEQVVMRLQQTALQLQSEGKWQEAETVLQRALRIDVQKVDIYHQLATVRMGQQRFDEAEQIAMKGLTYTDKSPRFKSSLWQVIAQCRSAQGDIAGANEARAEVLKWMTE